MFSPTLGLHTLPHCQNPTKINIFIYNHERKNKTPNKPAAYTPKYIDVTYHTVTITSLTALPTKWLSFPIPQRTLFTPTSEISLV
jgi:hypothetical protein